MRIDYSKLKCYCGSCGWKAEFIPAKRRPGPHKAEIVPDVGVAAYASTREKSESNTLLYRVRSYCLVVEASWRNWYTLRT